MWLPYCIGTDLLSELFIGINTLKPGPSPNIWVHHKLTISHITKYEVLKGLKAKKAQKQIDTFNIFCNANNIVPITDDVIIKAADIYATLRGQGNIISDADIFVAAMAIINDFTLITNNTSHFSRIQDLKFNNWKT